MKFVECLAISTNVVLKIHTKYILIYNFGIFPMKYKIVRSKKTECIHGKCNADKCVCYNCYTGENCQYAGRLFAKLHFLNPLT